MTKQKVDDIFLVPGAVWIIVGLIIYPNAAVWPLGFIFLITGLIKKYEHREFTTKSEQRNPLLDGIS